MDNGLEWNRDFRQVYGEFVEGTVEEITRAQDMMVK